MGGKWTIAAAYSLRVIGLFRIAAMGAVVSVSACGSSSCRLPGNWVLARTINKPLSPPGTPSPLFYAHEISHDRWSWQLETIPSMIGSAPSSSGSYGQLLQELTLARDFNPTPLFLFSFANGQTCSELNAERERIADAAPCSNDGRHCVQGNPAELSKWANE
jgi:hypothetical protein